MKRAEFFNILNHPNLAAPFRLGREFHRALTDEGIRFLIAIGSLRELIGHNRVKLGMKAEVRQWATVLGPAKNVDTYGAHTNKEGHWTVRRIVVAAPSEERIVYQHRASQAFLPAGGSPVPKLAHGIGQTGLIFFDAVQGMMSGLTRP